MLFLVYKLGEKLARGCC